MKTRIYSNDEVSLLLLHLNQGESVDCPPPPTQGDGDYPDEACAFGVVRGKVTMIESRFDYEIVAGHDPSESDSSVDPNGCKIIGGEDDTLYYCMAYQDGRPVTVRRIPLTPGELYDGVFSGNMVLVSGDALINGTRYAEKTLLKASLPNKGFVAKAISDAVLVILDPK